MADARDILVVEDNPADVRLIQEALRFLQPPPNVHIVSDGEKALHFLSRTGQFAGAARPVLVFLDFHLPKTDPGEVLGFIKQSKELHDIAVVVLTTSATEELIRHAYNLGANCYLSKPSDLDAFFHTVQAAAGYWLNFPAAPQRTGHTAKPENCL